MSSVATIVANLKQNGQDFEFYPTTNEILEAMFWDIKSHKRNFWFKDENTIENKGYDAEYEFQSVSILDIGAGNCKLLDKFHEISEAQSFIDKHGRKVRDNMLGINRYMAIEKSQILISKMPKEVIVVGTDFNENTIIDKQADIVFCNPPYREYERWTERIIKEANANFVYLVIPKRWGNSRVIGEALKLRRAKVQIVGDFDFLNSEDRKARAKVSLVKVCLSYYKGYKSRHSKKVTRNYNGDKVNVDPFELWFNENFKIQAEKSVNSWDEYKVKEKREEERKARIKNELVEGRDIVHTLVQLYNRDLNKLISNYQKLTELDADILKELDVKLDGVLGALKTKIQGLKVLYWEEIFNNFDAITSRLTSFTRQRLKEQLAANTNIDFTEGNIRSIVIWVIKNASKYFQEQMLEMYDRFTAQEGIKLYKSNAHWINDGWRYCQKMKENGIKWSLDYRIILDSARGWEEEKNGTISNRQMQDIRDLIVVAKNLGFKIDTSNIPWEGLTIKEKHNIIFSTGGKEEILKKGSKTLCGKIDEVFCQTHIPNENGERVMKKDGVVYVDRSDEQDYTYYQYRIGDYYFDKYVPREEDIFTTVVGHRKGTNHFQFNQKFIKCFNLEVSRVRGWIKSPKEASEEFDISIEEATKYWESSFMLLPSHLSNLLPNIEPKEESAVRKQERNITQTNEPKNLFDFDVA